MPSLSAVTLSQFTFDQAFCPLNLPAELRCRRCCNNTDFKNWTISASPDHLSASGPFHQRLNRTNFKLKSGHFALFHQEKNVTLSTHHYSSLRRQTLHIARYASTPKRARPHRISSRTLRATLTPRNALSGCISQDFTINLDLHCITKPQYYCCCDLLLDTVRVNTFQSSRPSQ
jgi:hypothetical protein